MVLCESITFVMKKKDILPVPFQNDSETWHFLQARGLELLCFGAESLYPDDRTMVLFQREGRLYGIRQLVVQDIVSLGNYTPLPFTQPCILGLVHLADILLPVLDIVSLMSGTRKRPPHDACLIVVHLNDVEVGLLADSILPIPERQVSTE